MVRASGPHALIMLSADGTRGHCRGGPASAPRRPGQGEAVAGVSYTAKILWAWAGVSGRWRVLRSLEGVGGRWQVWRPLAGVGGRRGVGGSGQSRPARQWPEPYAGEATHAFLAAPGRHAAPSTRDAARGLGQITEKLKCGWVVLGPASWGGAERGGFGAVDCELDVISGLGLWTGLRAAATGCGLWGRTTNINNKALRVRRARTGKARPTMRGPREPQGVGGGARARGEARRVGAGRGRVGRGGRRGSRSSNK